MFAGFLEHTDHYIGELRAFLKEIGEYENTLIMLISDNGANTEGGPNGSVNDGKFFNNVPDNLQQNLAAIDDIGEPTYFTHSPWGWTFAGNTPFRRWKRETYRGGTSDPFMRTIRPWAKGGSYEDRRGRVAALVALATRWIAATARAQAPDPTPTATPS